MRFSLRELAIGFTVASVAIPALYFANVVTYAVCFSVVAVLVGRAMIRVFATTDRERLTAIGFILPAVGYFLLAYTSQRDWTTWPSNGALPTSQLMHSPLQWAQTQRRPAAPPATLTPVPPPATRSGLFYNPASPSQFVYAPPTSVAPAPAIIPTAAPPYPRHFMPIAHCLWTLLFGYAGAKYAGCVYDRRQCEQSS